MSCVTFEMPPNLAALRMLTHLQMKKMTPISKTTFSNEFFVWKSSIFFIKTSLKFVPKSQIDKSNPAYVWH